MSDFSNNSTSISIFLSLPSYFYGMTAREIKEIFDINLNDIPDYAIYKSDKRFHYHDFKETI